MANLPIEFEIVSVVATPTLHLSFDFDIVSSIDFDNESGLSIVQRNPIQAFEISLAGRISNPGKPNISVAMNAGTKLFYLNSTYLTDIYPHIKDDPPKKCFVIEGYSIESADKEKVFIFLPMNLITTTKNVFSPLENAILDLNKNTQLNLNEFIPKNNLETDYYCYYKNIDDSGRIQHIIFFKNSYLGHTSALTIPSNPTGYSSTKDGTIIYKTTTLAMQHNSMTNKFEDNIYIDCVPVDLVNQQENNYMQVNRNNANYVTDMLVVLCYLIALGFVIYGIYYFYILTSSPASAPKT
jgi:hypothetical protein